MIIFVRALEASNLAPLGMRLIILSLFGTNGVNKGSSSYSTEGDVTSRVISFWVREALLGSREPGLGA